MSNNDWTNKLRDQLADYQEPVSRDLWAGIEQSLAQKTGHQEVTGPGKIIHINTWKRWSAAAAAVALLGVGGSYVYFHQEEDKLVSSQLAMVTDKPSASAVAKNLHPAENASEMVLIIRLYLFIPRLYWRKIIRFILLVMESKENNTCQLMRIRFLLLRRMK